MLSSTFVAPLLRCCCTAKQSYVKLGKKYYLKTAISISHGGAQNRKPVAHLRIPLRQNFTFFSVRTPFSKKNVFTDNKVINRTFSGMHFFPTSAQLSSKSEEIKIALIIIFALSKSVVPAVLLYIFPACDSVRRQVHNTKRSTQLNRTLWHTGAIRFAFSCYD